MAKQFDTSVKLDPNCKLVAIQYHEDKYGALERLEKTENGDWIDLRAAEQYEYKAGDDITIALGVSMRLPAGYEAHIQPRSSAFKRWGILSATSGIVDNSYCGRDDEWFFHVYATRDGVIEKGDRICQFRIMKNQPHLIFQEELLSERGRGASLYHLQDPVPSKIPEGVPVSGDTLYFPEKKDGGDILHKTVHANGYDKIHGWYFTFRDDPSKRYSVGSIGKLCFRDKHEAYVVMVGKKVKQERKNNGN